MDSARGWVVVGIDNGGTSNTATILDDFQRMKEGEPLVGSKADTVSGNY